MSEDYIHTDLLENKLLQLRREIVTLKHNHYIEEKNLENQYVEACRFFRSSVPRERYKRFWHHKEDEDKKTEK